MLVFLDFEASSLGKQGVPIEIAWVWENGRSEAHLIRPAPGWDDWDAEAEAIHRIPRATLVEQGEAHDVVARRMVDELTGHDLLASAPSWDGKWLSALLRAAGLPRHSLRLRDTEEAQREGATDILAGSMQGDDVKAAVTEIIASVAAEAERETPAHRALADAEAERQRWSAVCAAARARAASIRQGQQVE